MQSYPLRRTVFQPRIVLRSQPDFISQLPIFHHSCEIKSRSGLRPRGYFTYLHQQDQFQAPHQLYFVQDTNHLYSQLTNVNGFPSFSGNDCSCTIDTYILLHQFPCNTGEYCTSVGMYFHESEGRVKILLARVQYSPVLHGNQCNKRFLLSS